MVRLAPGAGQARVYDVSGHVSASLGASLGVGSRATAAERRDRRKSALASRDTDLLHDFSFPTVATRVKVSPDERFVFAAGSYPPQIHVYDTAELSLKFKRHLVSDVVDFQILEDDWRKFAVLTADRFVDLHSQNGSHFRIRVPRPGRDLMLHRGTADLFVCGAGPDVWRLNLEQGRFLAPLTTSSPGNNVCGISPRNQLLAFGGESGVVEIWDPRALHPRSRPAGSLDIGRALAVAPAMYGGGSPALLQSLAQNDSLQVSALRFDDVDGISLAVGTTTGQTLLFDLRSPAATLVRDQGYDAPIRSLKLLRDRKHCVSADAKSIKVWDRNTGHNMVAVEPDADVNHVCVVGDSGVFCAAAEDSRVRSYYVPALGPAPKWCTFLDSFTEELEDANVSVGLGQSSLAAGGTIADSADADFAVYENYKFVPREELEGLGLAHLVGTDMLKPYMHGFFVHMRLYRRAVDAASPFAYEQYRKERAKAKMEMERESRIGKTRRRSAVSAAKVNQSIAAQLASKRVSSSGRQEAARATAAATILEDERFSALFSNADFKVDESDERFQHLNPSGVADANPNSRGRSKNVDSSESEPEYLDQFDEIDDDRTLSNAADARVASRQTLGNSDGEDAEDDEDDEGDEGDIFSSHVDERGYLGKNGARAGEGEAAGISKPKRSLKKVRKPRMYALNASAEILGTKQGEAGRPALQKRIVEQVPLGKRVSNDKGAP